MYDPSIGNDSLSLIDIIGVLFGHLVFGIGLTLLMDWSWIPLSEEDKKRGKSLLEIKKSWSWDE